MAQMIRYWILFGIVISTAGARAIAHAPLQGTPPAPAAKETAVDVTKGSKDVDQVLEYPLPVILEAARQAFLTYGCEMKKETHDSLECKRSRHIGVFVGSGGEKVTVRLEAVPDGTRVRIKTGKGLVGRMGKKNWSTPIFSEIVRRLKTS